MVINSLVDVYGGQQSLVGDSGRAGRTWCPRWATLSHAPAGASTPRAPGCVRSPDISRILVTALQGLGSSRTAKGKTPNESRHPVSQPARTRGPDEWLVMGRAAGLPSGQPFNDSNTRCRYRRRGTFLPCSWSWGRTYLRARSSSLSPAGRRAGGLCQPCSVVLLPSEKLWPLPFFSSTRGTPPDRGPEVKWRWCSSLKITSRQCGLEKEVSVEQAESSRTRGLV